MSPLPQRPLGDSGIELTSLGLGTWAIGGGDWMFGWGHQDEREAIQAIIRGVELGINWIDTAAVYGNGRSEELVASALAQLPAAQRPLVATKCGRLVQPDGSVIGNIKAESVRAECEASLRRLGVEAIDLYQLHWPAPEEDIEEAWHTMVQLLEAGKVRRIGVSNHSVAQMERLAAIHPITSLQPPYSMLVREVEESILPYCARQRIGVITYSPLYKGMLTGKFSRQRVEDLPTNDHRRRDPNFQEPRLSAHLDLVSKITGLAERHQRTPGELALAWILRRPEVTSAIVGARRPDQIEALVEAGSWELNSELLRDVDQALAEHSARVPQATFPRPTDPRPTD